MDRPWFRRWFGFSYRPICWQGWAATLVWLAVSLALGLLFLGMADTHPIWSWISATVCAVLASVFYAIVVWKLERDYES